VANKLSEIRGIRFKDLKDGQRAVDQISEGHNNLIRQLDGNPFIDGASITVPPTGVLEVTVDNPLGRTIRGAMAIDGHPVFMAASQPANKNLCSLVIQPWRYVTTLNNGGDNAATEISFDTDGQLARAYSFRIVFNNGSGGSVRDYKLYPNGVTVGTTDGRTQRGINVGTSGSFKYEDAMLICQFSSSIGFFDTYFDAAVRDGQGYSRRFQSTGGASSGNPPGFSTANHSYHGHWQDLTTEITSLTFACTGADGFDSLTEIIVYEHVPTVDLKVWLY
jgi:hypothetical protein